MKFLGINSIFISQGLKLESSSVISSSSESSSKRKSNAMSSKVMQKFWFRKKLSSSYVRRISPSLNFWPPKIQKGGGGGAYLPKYTVNHDLNHWFKSSFWIDLPWWEHILSGIAVHLEQKNYFKLNLYSVFETKF